MSVTAPAANFIGKESCMPTIGSTIVTAIGDLGVTQVWGVVGDALNPITDAIRDDDRVEWIGVRHEEAAAFAAGAQAQLTGTLGVCMGTVGPGSLHLLNGLYDAKKSHAPMLAICGQVPSMNMGTDFFQEVNNDAVFADVSVFNATVTSPAQMPYLLEQAVNTALALKGVAILTIPGDIGAMDAPEGAPQFAQAHSDPAADAGGDRPDGSASQRRQKGHDARRSRRPGCPRRGFGCCGATRRAHGADTQR